MRNWWRYILTDETGSATGTEWAFVVTLLVLGAITGAVVSRPTVLQPAATPPAQIR